MLPHLVTLPKFLHHFLLITFYIKIVFEVMATLFLAAHFCCSSFLQNGVISHYVIFKMAHFQLQFFDLDPGTTLLWLTPLMQLS